MPADPSSVTDQTGVGPLAGVAAGAVALVAAAAAVVVVVQRCARAAAARVAPGAVQATAQSSTASAASAADKEVNAADAEANAAVAEANAAGKCDAGVRSAERVSGSDEAAYPAPAVVAVAMAAASVAAVPAAVPPEGHVDDLLADLLQPGVTVGSGAAGGAVAWALPTTALDMVTPTSSTAVAVPPAAQQLAESDVVQVAAYAPSAPSLAAPAGEASPRDLGLDDLPLQGFNEEEATFHRLFGLRA